jgi:choline dehydrogenase-like flavoprotein
MLIDARQLPSRAVLRARFCVIGSGMGGATLAQSLARAQQDVLLVEAGTLQPALADGSQVVSWESIGRSFNAPPTRCIELGGTSNQWHGICAPLDEMDFAERAWIPGSGWPITRSELQTFYDEAASLHEVPEWAGYDTATLAPGFQARLGDIRIREQVLRHKIVYARKPPMRWKEPLLQHARAGRLRCLLSAPALELVSTESGQSISKLIVGAGEQTQEIHADYFIVCCGALETPRLLLNSRRNGSPAPGNGHDLVGRNLLDHPAGHFCKVRFCSPTSAPMYAALALGRALNITIALMQAPEHQRLHSVPNHYAWIRPSVSAARIDDDLLLSFLGVRGLRDLSLRQIKAILTDRDIQYRILVQRFGMHPTYRYGDMYFTTEQLPNPDSRIRLSASRRDRYGYPIASIDWQLSDADLSGFERYSRLLFQQGLTEGQCTLARVDPASTWSRTVASTAHHLGTARMGVDPTRGVVDRNLRIFGLENAYVCDGSVFPTAGSANPSLTITALARRLARHLLNGARAS